MKIISILCSIIFALSVGNAQKLKRLAEHRVGCDGLTTLPFSNQESKTKDLEPRVIDGVEVQVKSHLLSNEQIVFLATCSQRSGGKGKAVDERGGQLASVVRGLLSYEVGGRTFAYSFVAYAVVVKDGFILERAGAAHGVYYVDDDGDDTFERRPLKTLPNWVKALADKSKGGA